MDQERSRPRAEGRQSPPVGLTVPGSYVPHRVPAVSELEVGDGLILYVEEADLIHRLNASAALIWRLCDGEVTVGQLAAEIAEEYELEIDEVRRQVSSLIGELDALGLVSHDPAGADPS